MKKLADATRTVITEKEFSLPVEAEDLSNGLLTRVSAKGITFKRVLFRKTLFDNCYFRNCSFEDCDFTGAQFSGTNLRGSSFEGSRFDYCRFSNTAVPLAVLERHMPGYENVALELARSLRTNYAQLGNTEGVKLAIAAELEATRVHLQKATWSRDSYYRSRYAGLARWRAGVRYYSFIALDFLWGNGESLLKLLRTIALAYAMIVVGLVLSGQPVLASCRHACELFSGVGATGTQFPILAVASAFVRFVLLGLFVSVLVKRLARR